MKALRKLTKRKREKKSSKKRHYESSDDSDSDSDSEQDVGCYEYGILSSEIDNALISSLNNKNQSRSNSSSLSDTKLYSNYNNKNIPPIKFVDKSLYKEVQKVIKSVGTYLTVAAVPHLINFGKQNAK